ncbi:hypothetical protein JKP88DRAFT_294549 [Tribonema minus]|uniref:Uncharacterized protein n=1 Tax=Tribonema minus TaxID=303371 RepID=A0A836CNL3_9STRA|nr:hypothetical protein JKP88DRAFT_294549 [Tribonema minus]
MAERQLKLREAGGACELLTTGLQSTWKQSPFNIQGALITVAELLCSCPNALAKFGDIGAAVVAAMNTHGEDAGVQQAGIHVIQALARIDGARMQLRGCNALEALADAMRAHPHSSDIQECAADAAVLILWHGGRLIDGLLQRGRRTLRE